MKEKVALLSIAANGLLGLAKVLVGLASGSVAVLSEGIHSAVDLLSSIICLVGIKIAKKPVDERHPYGHYKFEVLAGVVITVILAATGIFILKEAYHSFTEPADLSLGPLTLGVMMFSALLNELMARLKIHYGQEEGSVSLISEGVHSRADVYSSLAILAGLVINPYWKYADPILAGLVGLYILKESLSLGKEATNSLLDVSAGEEVENQIKSIVVEQEGLEVTELKTQNKGSAVTANLKIKLPSQMSVEEASNIANKIRNELMQAVSSLTYVAIQIESHDLDTSYHKPALGLGRGFGWQRRGRFKGEVEEAQGKGPEGSCLCQKCGYKVGHQRGVPCSSLKCPHCQSNLVRES